MLKQSRKKAYEVILKRARREGTLDSNPGAVLKEIWARLHEFQEPDIERSMRAERNWTNLRKGRKSCKEFLPHWENAKADLELCDLGLTEVQYYYQYLKKLPCASKSLKTITATPQIYAY